MVPQVSFGALPTAERLEVLRLVTAKMPMASDLELATVAESMRCADGAPPYPRLPLGCCLARRQRWTSPSPKHQAFVKSRVIIRTCEDRV